MYQTSFGGEGHPLITLIIFSGGRGLRPWFSIILYVQWIPKALTTNLSHLPPEILFCQRIFNKKLRILIWIPWSMF